MTSVSTSPTWQKTDTHRQTDLIALLLADSVTANPESH